MLPMKGKIKEIMVRIVIKLAFSDYLNYVFVTDIAVK